MHNVTAQRDENTKREHIMKGNIFNIQKFSLHDGPGLRTTVFLKGCPLRCRWCSNPESQTLETLLSYDERKCLHCESCARVCPEGCIGFDGGTFRLDRSACTGCLACVKGCPGKALQAEGEQLDADEVVRICMQDADFYAESGGGVTLSGGECMMQSKFTAELARKLKMAGVHIAAETTGCVAPETFRALAPLFDLLLFDVKHYDSEMHRRGTGVGNERIIENLTQAKSEGLNILPRIPVIPRFNASLSDAEGIAALLHRVGLERAQLLPFHQFGERKYELLGREYGYAGEKALRNEDLEEYRQVFLNHGIDCFI